MFKDDGFAVLLEALNATPKDDFPVASFLEVEGRVFPAFTNRVYADQNHLNHAEILAISDALKNLGIMDFKSKKATLYSSLEPCCMCLAFASLTRITKVIYYAEDVKFGGTERIYSLNSAFTKPELLFIEKQEVKTLMNNFFKSKR